MTASALGQLMSSPISLRPVGQEYRHCAAFRIEVEHVLGMKRGGYRIF